MPIRTKQPVLLFQADYVPYIDGVKRVLRDKPIKTPPVTCFKTALAYIHPLHKATPPDNSYYMRFKGSSRLYNVRNLWLKYKREWLKANVDNILADL